MTDFSDDIKRYLSGEMTPAERHALEKKALSDPFLADALEGAAQISPQHFTDDIDSLHTLLDQHVNQQAGGISFWTWGLRLAAGLLLITITSYIFWNLLEEKSTTPQLSSVEKNEADPSSASSMDSTARSNTKDQLALTENLREEEPIRAEKSREEMPVLLSEKDLSTTGHQKETEVISNPVLLSEEKDLSGAGNKETVAEAMAPAEAKKEVASYDDAIGTGRSAERSAKKSISPSATQNFSIISGNVFSAEDGSPLPGVNVTIKGTTKGTVTDKIGNYTLENASPASTLVYSFIGLQSKEVPVGERRIIDAEMSVDMTQLSEIVVTGYGYSQESETTPTVDLAHPSIGTRAYKKYLEETLRYPQGALDNKVEGRVTVEFFVESNGRLDDFTIIKGIGSGCDEELIRLIKEGPAWIPTKKDEVPIRDKARVRLKFDVPKD
jgi:TonB family protein